MLQVHILLLSNSLHTKHQKQKKHRNGTPWGGAFATFPVTFAAISISCALAMHLLLRTFPITYGWFIWLDLWRPAG